ncbi:MAG: hypothetical protein HY858_00845 [Candidatus Solibacter usitatus]|nr:hypothetical protein [Candidatus Solibacter usitatus]
MAKAVGGPAQRRCGGGGACAGRGQRVYVHMGAAAPQALLDALCEHAPRQSARR